MVISETEPRLIVPPKKTIPALSRFVPLILGLSREKRSFIWANMIPNIKLIAACPITNESEIKMTNRK